MDDTFAIDVILAICNLERAAQHVLRDAPVIEADTCFSDAGCDQLTRISIHIAVEEAFGVEIPDHVAARWQRPNDIAATVRAMCGEAA